MSSLKREQRLRPRSFADVKTLGAEHKFFGAAVRKLNGADRFQLKFESAPVVSAEQ